MVLLWFLSMTFNLCMPPSHLNSWKFSMWNFNFSVELILNPNLIKPFIFQFQASQATTTDNITFKSIKIYSQSYKEFTLKFVEYIHVIIWLHFDLSICKSNMNVQNKILVHLCRPPLTFRRIPDKLKSKKKIIKYQLKNWKKKLIKKTQLNSIGYLHLLFCGRTLTCVTSFPVWVYWKV